MTTRLLGPTAPETSDRRPVLTVRTPHGRGPVDGVVLVLHGGRSTSTAPTSPLQLAVLRMLPFGPAVARAGHRDGLRIATARLRYRVRGWNGRRQDPVVDTRWALDELRSRFPGAPVVLLGHSMGGRTALALAGAPDVVGVVGLAPWVELGTGVEPGDGIGDVTGRRVTVLHGTDDRMTDPRASRAWVDLAGRRGAVTRYLPVEGAGHPMLRRAGWWHRTAAAAVVESLRAARPGDDPRPGTGQDVSELGPETLRSTTGSRSTS